MLDRLEHKLYGGEHAASFLEHLRCQGTEGEQLALYLGAVDLTNAHQRVMQLGHLLAGQQLKARRQPNACIDQVHTQ